MKFELLKSEERLIKLLTIKSTEKHNHWKQSKEKMGKIPWRYTIIYQDSYALEYIIFKAR